MNPTATISEEEAQAVRAAAAQHAEELAAQRPRYFALWYYGSEDGAGDKKAAVFYRSPEERQAIREAWYAQGGNVRIVGVTIGEDGTPSMSIADVDGYDTKDIGDVMNGNALEYCAEHERGGTLEAGTLREAFDIVDAQNADTMAAMFRQEVLEKHAQKAEEDEGKRLDIEAAKAWFAAACAFVVSGAEAEAAEIRAIACAAFLASGTERDIEDMDEAAKATIRDIGGDRMLDYIGEAVTDSGKLADLLARFPSCFGRKSEILQSLRFEIAEQNNNARAFDRIIDDMNEREREIYRERASAEECRTECMEAAEKLLGIERKL